MLFLEFAAQGIRGVAPAGGRATLRPGYNVVAADGPALRRLFEALLRPDPGDVEALARAQGSPGAGPVRAGLTLVGDDRVTYRLVRDFGAGCQLHRFDPEKRAFASVSQDLAEIAALLRSPAGVPTAGRLAALLSLAASELPSKASGGLGTTPAMPVARQVLSGAAASQRVEELRGELERARLAEKLQEQLDAHQARLFKLEDALKSGQRVQDQLGAAEAERAALQPVAEVATSLGDVAACLAAFERSADRRAEAEVRIAAEREGILEAEARGAPPPVWTSPPFLAGVAVGLALLVAGLAAGGSELRYLALLDIPAFGWSAWHTFRWIDAHEAWGRIGRRRRVVDDWEAKVLAQFERDAGAVHAALKTLGLATPAELKDALERLAVADQQVAEARKVLAAWEVDAQTTDALAEHRQVEEAMRAVETRLSEQAGGFVRDVQSVQAELARVEADAAAPPPAPQAPSLDRPAVVAIPTGEPLRGLLERAAVELGGSPASVGRALAAKASQAISSFTLNRLTGVSADDRGNVQVVTGGRPVPAMTLPPAERDLVFLALKLALLEQAVASDRTVAILEDAFAGMSETVRRAAGRLLKSLAKPGQVIHASADAAFREAADHQA